MNPSEIPDLFTPKTAHFVGIAGVGMAGVARLLRFLDWEVSGCDLQENEITAWLNRNGIPTACPHSPLHLNPKPELVIRTPAVPDSAPELCEARTLGLPILPRGTILAKLSEHFASIAVCGSHGKTTSSTFLATILHATLPKRTLWCIGGYNDVLGGVAGGCPAASPAETLLVAEADESDGTLALYAPETLLVTNIDYDHVDRFASPADFEAVFIRAIQRTRGKIFFCRDHENTTKIVSSHAANAVSFGFHPAAQWRILDYTLQLDGSQAWRFSSPDGRCFCASLPMLGEHNLLNALSAIAVASEYGIDPQRAADLLAQNAKLPARRFECAVSAAGFCVITDYAHHPTEIRALIRTAKLLPHRRVLGIFQPHRYTRTLKLRSDFPTAFEGLDELILCPVYAASEPPLPGGSTADLYLECRKAQASNPALSTPLFAQSFEDALSAVALRAAKDDLVLVIGAGDVNSLTPQLLALSELPAPDSVKALALSGYGTTAPVAHEFCCASTSELQAALAACKKQGLTPALIGAGTNTLLPDTGLRHHAILRLRGDELSAIRVLREDDSEALLHVGAAAPGGALLAHCRKHGFSGLESLAGIPGCIGGWLAMNAGTREGCFCDALSSVSVLSLAHPEAGPQTLLRDELRASYRSCPGLHGFVALSATLRLSKATPEAVAAAMTAKLEKRFSFQGLRSCGSAFKNPPDAPPAGALSDQAGCKSLSVGGAFVSPNHGNIFAANPSATASDVLALFSLVHDRVLAASAIDLSPEVKILSDSPSL